MNTMLPALAVQFVSSVAQAQTSAADHAAHHPAPSAAGASAPAAALTDAEVRRVDKDQKKLTLRHGSIPSLDMPPMTMVFQVSDARLLNDIKVGDKVRFAVGKVNGAFVVTAIEKASP